MIKYLWENNEQPNLLELKIYNRFAYIKARHEKIVRIDVEEQLFRKYGNNFLYITGISNAFRYEDEYIPVRVVPEGYHGKFSTIGFVADDGITYY